MPTSIVDYKTPEEQTIYDFYEEHPGATWVEAAEALGMEEEHAFRVSNQLRLYGELRTDFSLKQEQLMRFWIHELEEAPLMIDGKPLTTIESVQPIGRYYMGDT